MLWFLGGWIHELPSEVTECPLSSLTGWGTQRSPELSTEGGHLGRGGPGAAMGPAASRPGAEWTDPFGRTWPGREANTLKSWAGHQTPELHGAPHVPAHPSGWHQGANSIPQLGRKTGTQFPVPARLAVKGEVRLGLDVRQGQRLSSGSGLRGKGFREGPCGAPKGHVCYAGGPQSHTGRRRGYGADP